MQISSSLSFQLNIHPISVSAHFSQNTPPHFQTEISIIQPDIPSGNESNSNQNFLLQEVSLLQQQFGIKPSKGEEIPTLFKFLKISHNFLYSKLFHKQQPTSEMKIDDFDQLIRRTIRSNKDHLPDKIFQVFGHCIHSPQNHSTSELHNIFIQQSEQIYSNIKQIYNILLGESHHQPNVLSQNTQIQQSIESLITDQKNQSSKPSSHHQSLFSRVQKVFSQQNQVQLKMKFISTILDLNIDFPDDFDLIQYISN
jgi:hypothetical protein